MKPIHFWLGMAAGTAVGLLLAPKSGAKNRAYLATKAKEGTEYAKRSADAGVDYLQRQGDRLQKNASDAIDTALNAGKRAYNDAVE